MPVPASPLSTVTAPAGAVTVVSSPRRGRSTREVQRWRKEVGEALAGGVTKRAGPGAAALGAVRSPVVGVGEREADYLEGAIGARDRLRLARVDRTSAVVG